MTPTPEEIATLGSLVREYGVQAVVIGFFIWRDWQREKEMAAKITAVEAYVRDTLMDTLKESSATIAQNSRFMASLIAALSSRMCLASERLSEEVDGDAAKSPKH